MVRHFETVTHDGSTVHVSIDHNIAWAVIDEGPGGMVREYGIAIPGGGSFEHYAEHPTFTVRHVEREYAEPGGDDPYDSEELIQLYLTETGIGFEWRLLSDQFSKWDRVADPATPHEDMTTTRDRMAAD